MKKGESRFRLLLEEDKVLEAETVLNVREAVELKLLAAKEEVVLDVGTGSPDVKSDMEDVPVDEVVRSVLIEEDEVDNGSEAEEPGPVPGLPGDVV